MGRILGIGIGSLVGLLLWAAPANAELTSDTAGCTASATVTGDDGSTVTIDATQRSVTIPRSETATWTAATNRVTHDHRGSLDLQLGPLSINLGTWGPTSNDQDQSTKEGLEDIPAVMRQFPSVKWKVTGFHQGIEGQCRGEITVEMEGSGASTAAAGVAGLAGTAAAAAGLLAAARPKQPYQAGGYR